MASANKMNMVKPLGADYNRKEFAVDTDGTDLIPQGAIQRDTVSAYAMIVGKDGNVVRKNVVTQQAVGADWLVTEGLAAGGALRNDAHGRHARHGRHRGPARWLRAATVHHGQGTEGGQPVRRFRARDQQPGRSL